MNLKKLKTIIMLASVGAAVVVVGASAAAYYIPSYIDWKTNFDAIMEEKELAKYEYIEGVCVTDVTLKQVGYKPCYVISGKYDPEKVNPADISFKLYTLNERANFAENVIKQVDTSTHSFLMYADISMTSADGDGNARYDIDSASVTYADSVDQHAYYPKLVIGEKEANLENVQISWDGASLEFDNCTYKITHNNNTGVFPFGMPALLKTTEQEIPADATYTATGVEFCSYGDDVCFNIHGTSQGYNRDTLSKDITFELRGMVGTVATWAIRGTQGGPVIMEENGDFILTVRLNNIPTCKTNPFYSRFGNARNEKNDICDLFIPGINGSVDQQTIKQDGRDYTLYIAHGTGAANGYGTTGVKVTESK